MPSYGRHRYENGENVASFRAVYKEQCQNSYVCARRGLLSKIPDDDALDLFVDIIRTDDWKPLLQALRLDKSLRVISFKSSFLSDYPEIVADVTRLQLIRKVQKDIRIPSLFTPEVFQIFCSSLTEHLKVNSNLKSLELHGFPFSVSHLQEISTGLHEAKSLTSLSLNGCPLGKRNLETICEVLRSSSTLKVLSLCDCQLDEVAVQALGSLLRLQCLHRHGEAWREGLRERPLLLDSFGGLRRLSLSNNPIGDQGAATVVAALGDDVWVKALDLQNCGIGNTGATALLNHLYNNIVLEVVDVRRNPNIEAGLSAAISQKVQANRKGRQCEFDLLPLDRTRVLHEKFPRLRSRSASRVEEVRMPLGKKRLRSSSLDRGISKGSGKAPRWPLLHPALRHSKETAQRGKAGFPIISGSLQEGSAKKELSQCQESLSKERALRHEAEQKLLKLFEENRQLRAKCEKLERPGYTLVENSLLRNIETTFVRFLLLQNMKSGNAVSTPPEQAHDGKSNQKVKKASGFQVRNNMQLQEGKSSEGDLNHPLLHQGNPPEENVKATKKGAAKMESLVPLDRRLFQGFIASKAEKIISDIRSKQSSVAEHDSRSSMPSIPKSTVKYPREQPGQPKTLSSFAEGSANASYRSSLRETSKRLSEILGIDHEPSKLLPTPVGSPVFFQLESEAASSEYRSDFLPSSSTVSSVSEADGKVGTTSSLGGTVSSKTRSSIPAASSGHPSTSKSSSKNSKLSQDATLVSSIQEEDLPTEVSAPSSYKHKSESVKVTKSSAALLSGTASAGRQKQRKEQYEGPSASAAPSAALPHQPSESYDIDTADITVSSIYSASGRPDKSKASTQGLPQWHSTPTFADEAEQVYDTVSTPSKISLSRNHSGASTPSTPDTLTSPQLAGSDFDGF